MQKDSDKSASREEEKERGVDLTWAEHALWPEQTPDNGRREEHTTARAGETLLLLKIANTFDVTQSEVKDS